MKTTVFTSLLILSATSILHAQAGNDPVVTLQQTPAIAHPLDSVTLSVSVTGAPAGTTFTYQWKRSGSGMGIVGATQPSFTIPRCLSRDLGTYECTIVATKGTNTRTLTGAIDCTCDYPEVVTVVETADSFAVIGTDGDDDVSISRHSGGVSVTVAAAGSKNAQDYRVDTFICCGVGSGRITVDLGDGMDFLECDVSTGLPVAAEGELLGGGQPGDIAILKDITGLPGVEVAGFETVAPGRAISGHLATGTMPVAGPVNPDSLTPHLRIPVVFHLTGGTQSGWSAQFVTNESGRFLGVLPPLPPGMTTANIEATVGGVTLTWPALGGSSSIGISSPSGPAVIKAGLGYRPVGPCAEIVPGQFPSLLVPFDEPATDPVGGAVCTNHVDLGKSALSGSPDVISGVAYRGRRFTGSGGGSYEVAGPAGVNPSTGEFSLNCWMRRDAVDDRIFRANQVMLDHTDAAGTTGWKLGAVRGQLYLSMGAGSLTTYTSPAAMLPADGAWHLVSVTVERYYSNEVIFYIDGAPAGTPLPTSGAPNLNNAAPLRIGPDFHGGMDELEFFNNRRLAGSEIYALWAAGSKGRCPIPRLYPLVLPYGVATEYSIASAALTNPDTIASLRQPLADSDADGFANRLEYAFGSDPLSPAGALKFTHAVSGTGLFTLSVHRPALRSAVESVIAEFTTDLQQWAPGSLLSTQPQPDGTIVETWAAPASAGTRHLGRLTETPVP